MTEKKTGGPAADKTLRDYFAGQVIVGIHANRNAVVYENAATEAYIQADAMIKEREK